MSLQAKLSPKKRQARKAQKKALAEAQVIIANNQLKPPLVVPSTDLPPVSGAPSAVEPTKNVLTTTQWLNVISIIVSLAGVYYKCEEIKGVFTKKPRARPPSPVEPRAPHPPSPVELRAPPPSPVDASPKRKAGIRKMD